jgi:Fungal protein kinase
MKDKVPHTKFPFRCQPDCCVYSADSGHNNTLDSSLIECLIEFKTGSDYDPFEQHVRSQSTAARSVRNPFMSTSLSGRKVAGQITAYATWVLSAQYRTHVFLVLVLKDFSRLIRWDRGGAVVTAPIYHNQEPHLLDFLTRFKDADPQARGQDITVRPPTEGEELKARELAELAGATSLLSLSIYDSSQLHESHYIICAPCSRPDVPAGRWTRTAVAYDVQRQQRVLLKDSWRVLLEDITPEGEIYATLHKHEVPNIPTCLQAGDIGDNRYHASRTHEFNNKYGSPCLSTHLVPHRHYRLVLDTVGRPLETFKRSWEFVNAIRDALVGKLLFAIRLAP